MHISHIGATEREYHSLERRCRTNWFTCRFVFDNYTWSRGEEDYSLYNLKPIPSRIPLSALIQGELSAVFVSPVAHISQSVKDKPHHLFEPQGLSLEATCPLARAYPELSRQNTFTKSARTARS